MFFFEKLDVSADDLDKMRDIKKIIDDGSDLLCELFLEPEFIEVDSSLKTSFSLNDMCNLGYQFLSERYPMIVDDYSMAIKNPDVFIVDNNKEQVDIIKFIFDRYFYYLRFHSSKRAFELLKEECDNSKVLKNYFQFAYDYLHDVDDNFKSHHKNIPMIRPLYKNKLNNQLNYDLESDGIIRANGTNFSSFNVNNTNDIEMVISFMHEYIHKTNMPVSDDKFNNSNLDKIYLDRNSACLFELPSISVETEFLEWLFEKNYINEVDYYFYKNLRLSSTIDTINLLKSNLSLVNVSRLNTNICINSLLKTNVAFSYIVANALAPCINDRLRNVYGYRNKLMEANDKLADGNFSDIIKILDLDYTDDKIYEEIKTSFYNYYEDYYKMNKKTK